MVANVGWNLSVIQPRIWACPSIKLFGLLIELKQVEEYLLSIDPSCKMLSKSTRVPLSVFQGSRTTNHQLSFSALVNLNGPSWINYCSRQLDPDGSSRDSRFSFGCLLLLKFTRAAPSSAGSSGVKVKITNARGSRFSVGY